MGSSLPGQFLLRGDVMKVRHAVLSFALLSIVACGSGTSEPQAMQPGDYSQTLTSGGLQRSYMLHVPLRYDGSKALPLVFVLHGYGGQAEGMAGSTGLSLKADQEGFFVAYLQGTLGSEGKSSWNTGIVSNDATVDDVRFVRDVARELEGKLKVDTRRIYATGFSQGGSMTHRLAAQLPDLLAGVATVESTVGMSEDQGITFKMIPKPKAPIAMLIIHGMQDITCPYDGGQGTNPDQWARSVADTVAFWTQADGCTAAPEITTSSDHNVITEDHAGCSVGTEVELVTIVSGKHQWPTAQNDAHFVGSDAVWDFFSRHALAN